MAPAGSGTKRKRNANGADPGPKSRKGKAKKVAEPQYGSDDEDLDSAGEAEWIVDEILDKKIENGKILYQLRWKNWDPSDLTWEPVANLNCSDLIKKFEANRNAVPNGFTTGLTFREIRGIVQLTQGRGDKLCYLVKFAEKDELEKIPSSVVRDKVPQEVIKYLASKIIWTLDKTDADREAAPYIKKASRSKSNSESSHQVSHKSDKENHHSDDDED